MASVKEYTLAVPVVCALPVKVGESRTWKLSLTVSSGDPADTIESSSTNTYWSLDGVTFYNSDDGAVAIGSALPLHSFIWVKFTPAFVDDIPGYIIIMGL